MWRVTVRLVAPMICGWKDIVWRVSARDARLSGPWESRLLENSSFPPIGNDNRATKRPATPLRNGGEGTFGERQFALALSLARTLLATRAQFVLALRDLAYARSGRERSETLFLHIVEQNVDDALYAIGRDGSATLEEIVRRAIDDIAKETNIGASGAPFFVD
jgi:hypothetical protein